MEQIREVQKALQGISTRWRSDWSSFDGRTLRDQLAPLIEALNEGSAPFIAKEYLESWGICPTCGYSVRRWDKFCSCGEENDL